MRALVISTLWLVSCGGEVVFVEDGETADGAEAEEEAACEEGGGKWRAGNCGGEGDHCDLQECVSVDGLGCRCGQGRCWDGTQCVPGKGF